MRAIKLFALILGTSIFVLTIGGCQGAKLKKPQRVTVLSYNILHGENVQGTSNLDQVAAIVNRLKPDLVAFQEVDNKTTRSKGLDLTAELSRRTGMEGHFGKAMDYAGGGYGEAVLSRLPIIEVKNNPLPSVDGAEPRAALEVHVGLPNGERIAFIGTHLDHLRNDKNRMIQAKSINEMFENCTIPMIMVGDLNATPDSDVMSELFKLWTDASEASPAPTIPSSNPKSRIDYVLYNPQQRWQVIESRVIDEKVASDHCPLFVVLELLPD
jgi:endonuclease/exonuclease/phosphatase family metal-dependent hydrolase